jgi:hypothetical protein
LRGLVLQYGDVHGSDAPRKQHVHGHQKVVEGAVRIERRNEGEVRRGHEEVDGDRGGVHLQEQPRAGLAEPDRGKRDHREGSEAKGEHRN